MKNNKISIVIPCYNEEEVLNILASKLETIYNRLIKNNKISIDSNIYFIDDGSNDNTWKLIEKICYTNSMFKGIKLSINQGHQNALMSGLLNVEADAIISMDADFQDDLNTNEKMIDLFNNGFEIVYSTRSQRKYEKRGGANIKREINILFTPFLNT